MYYNIERHNIDFPPPLLETINIDGFGVVSIIAGKNCLTFISFNPLGPFVILIFFVVDVLIKLHNKKT